MEAAVVHNERERFHPRVEANFMVKVWVDGHFVLTKARDLSMAGVYLLDPSFKHHTFTVAIPLPNDQEILTQCQVKRRHPTGMAVEFQALDWDDMFALARFLHPRLP